MNSKITLALLFVMFSLGGMIAIPGLSLVPTTTTTAHAQILTTPEELFPDFFDDGEDENANSDDGAVEAEDDDNGDDSGDEQGDDNQNIDQTNEQEQEVEQEAEQNNDQSETNAQSNELNTGDNTATVTQANAADQAVEAAAAEEEEEEEEEEAVSEDGSSDSESTTSSGVDGAEDIATATAEATGIIDQDNVAEVNQNSSANDNILVNENEFGDDTNIQVAVPIVDQEQSAANLAANIDLDITNVDEVEPEPEPEETFVVCVVFGMEQGTTRELTQEQIEELEEQGFNVAPGPCPPPEDGGGNAVYCFTYSAQGVPQNPICGETLQECQEFSQGGYLVISECQRYEEPPPNANCIRPGGTVSPC